MSWGGLVIIAAGVVALLTIVLLFAVWDHHDRGTRR
jgi:hypothetical protein